MSLKSILLALFCISVAFTQTLTMRREIAAIKTVPQDVCRATDPCSGGSVCVTASGTHCCTLACCAVIGIVAQKADEHCKMWNWDTQTCRTCSEGSIITKEGICIQAPFCQDISDEFVCNWCKKGYELVEGICIPIQYKRIEIKEEVAMFKIPQIRP